MISTLTSSATMVLPQLEIKTAAGKGKGVFTKTTLPAKTLVVVGRPLEESSERTSLTLQIDWNRHVKLDEMAETINHSCNPNLAVRNNRFGGYNFHTIRSIQPGEELTWDYGMTESESIAVDTCLCGSSQCRGKSFGFTQLNSEQQSKLHGQGIARYLSEWYLNQLQSRIVVKR